MLNEFLEDDLTESLPGVILNHFGGLVMIWGDAKNTRRCDLIDKEIGGCLTVEESAELQSLQEEFIAYRDEHFPLPIEYAKEIYRKLKDELGSIS